MLSISSERHRQGVFMIETIIAILFLVGIVLVATGPKASDKKGKDPDASSSPTPKAPDSPEK
jgi:hypothetical protein